MRKYGVLLMVLGSCFAVLRPGAQERRLGARARQARDPAPPEEAHVRPDQGPAKEEAAAKPPPDRVLTLADAVHWAAWDLFQVTYAWAQAAYSARLAKRFLPSDPARFLRYLWLGHLATIEERYLAWKVLSGHVNGLSGNSYLQALTPVPMTGYALLRLDVRHYQPTARQLAAARRKGLRIPIPFRRSVYEKLAAVDTNFNVRVQAVELVLDERTGKVKERIPLKKLKAKKKGKKKKKRKAVPLVAPVQRERRIIKTVTAPWLADNPVTTAAHAFLVERTRSQVPILFGTFFFQRTATAENRNADDPGYYEFLDIRNLDDYERLTTFREDEADGFIEYLEAVQRSGVSRKPRRLAFFEKKGGILAYTFDNRAATDTGNPLRVQDRKSFTAEALEGFSHLPNGWWAVVAANPQNRTLQASVPDFVGGVKHTRANRTVILVPTDCFHCHKTGGLQNFRAYFRNLYNVQTSVLRQQSPDYEVFELLKAQYLRPIEPLIDAGRLRYVIALRQVNGMSSQEYAKEYNAFYEKWAEGEVSLELAARELGTTAVQLQAALRAYLFATGAVDTVLAPYLAPDKEDQVIPREQWDEAYGLAQLVLRGQIPADFVLPQKIKRKAG